MTLLAAFAVFAMQGQEMNPARKQLSGIIKERTGQNGYEEYIDAALVSLTPRHYELLAYARIWKPGNPPPENLKKPVGFGEKPKLLDAYRLVAEEFESSFIVIEKGNQKDAFYPNELTVETLFPEYSHFRSIAFAYRCAAVVDIADGDAASASRRIYEGLLFARKMQAGPYIAILVGFAMENQLLGVINQNPRVFPAEFAKKIATLPNDIGPFRKAIDIEIALQRSTWSHFLSHPQVYLGDEDPAIAAIQNLAPARAKTLYDSVLSGMEVSWRSARQRVDEPEARWLEKLVTPPKPDMAEEAARLKGDEALVVKAFLRVVGEILVEQDGPANETQEAMLKLLACIRVQRRILGHTLEVARYRWEHNGKAPETLAEVYGGKEPLDPLNNMPYRLTRIGDSFKISLTVKGIGDVSLLGGPKPAGVGGPIEP